MPNNLDNPDEESGDKFLLGNGHVLFKELGSFGLIQVTVVYKPQWIEITRVGKEVILTKQEKVELLRQISATTSTFAVVKILKRLVNIEN